MTSSIFSCHPSFCHTSHKLLSDMRTADNNEIQSDELSFYKYDIFEIPDYMVEICKNSDSR